METLSSVKGQGPTKAHTNDMGQLLLITCLKGEWWFVWWYIFLCTVFYFLYILSAALTLRVKEKKEKSEINEMWTVL